MHLNVAYVATAAIIAVGSSAGALGATITAFAAADCDGAATDSINITSGCVYFTNGGSARSFSYSEVPSSIAFFESGGAHDICTNGAFTTLGSGSGCVSAPDGFNIESALVV